jgi:antitoxin ParD1/3/4
MATMNISVTDPMRAWVEKQVADGRYATASDCMRDVIRARMDHEERLTALRGEIQKGIDSGPSERSWQEVIAEARASIAGQAAVG